MADKTHCPHCHVSLQGAPIPEQYREAFGGKTHMSRAISVEVPEVYDGGLYYLCDDCGGTWHRWSPQHWQHARAEKYIHGPTKTTTPHKEQDNG